MNLCSSPLPVRLVVALLAGALSAGACAGQGEATGGVEPLGAITMSLTSVPSDVSCVELTITGNQTVVRRFDVTTGASTVLSAAGLPLGMVTVDEKAFSVPCAQVAPTTVPTWVSQGPVQVTLVPGQPIDVTIVMRRAGQIRVTGDFQDNPTLTVAPNSQNFGSIAIGQSAASTFTVSNTSTTNIPFAASLSGPDAAQFAIQGGSCGPVSTLNAGQSCTIQVRFSPTSTGTKAGTLVVGGAAVTNVSLSGTGLAGSSVTITPAGFNFTNVAVGSSSTTTVTVSNTGQLALTLSAGLSGADLSSFAIVGGTCTTTPTLNPGATCGLQVRFAPDTGGAKSALLSVGNPVAASAMFTGLGVVGGGLTVTPTSANLGAVPVGQSATANLTVTNVSTTAVPPTLTLLGPDTNQFVFFGGSCGAVSALAPSATCNVMVSFSPTSTGAKSASLAVGSNPVQTAAALSGTATSGSAVKLSPAVGDFGKVPVQSNQTLTFTVTNGGAGAVPLGFGFAGSDAVMFAVVGGTCGTLTTLNAGTSCTAQVRFAPIVGGTRQAIFTVGTPTLASMPLTGSGIVGGGVAFAPASANFGTVAIGANTTATMTLTNISTAAIIFSASVIGTQASQFALVGGSCGGLSTFAAGASCSLQVRFAPTSAGVKSAAVAIGGAPVQGTAALVGTGM